MKRYFNKDDNTYNNYCDNIDESYMVEIPDNGKPYGLVNGIVIDISETDDYKAKIAEEEKTIRKTELLEQIKDLDIKRIRAGFEPSIKNETTGETYLEYYTNQIQVLREQFGSL